MLSRSGVRATPRLCILALTVAAAFLAIQFAPEARASSNYNTTIEFTPGSGQAGTLVTATLSLQPAALATYALAATTTPPQQNGCAAAQPLSGVPSVRLVEPNPQASSGQVSFRWPEALGPGPYWLCAKAVGDDHPVLSSPVPFVAAASGARLNPVQVIPGHGASTNLFTVVVLDWSASDAPTLFLFPQGWPDGAYTPISQWETSAANGTNGTWAYTIQLPPAMANGTYAVIARAGCDSGQSCAVREQSAFFALGSGAVVPTSTFVPSPVPTATAITGTHPRRDTPSTGTPIMLLVGIGLLLAGSVTAFAWRFRLRPRTPSP